MSAPQKRKKIPVLCTTCGKTRMLEPHKADAKMCIKCAIKIRSQWSMKWV